MFFTCAADANPLGNYTLYENHTMLNMSRSGERIKAIHKHGQVIYTCEANNSVGSGKSSSIALNVESKFACNVNNYSIYHANHANRCANLIINGNNLVLVINLLPVLRYQRMKYIPVDHTEKCFSGI